MATRQWRIITESGSMAHPDGELIMLEREPSERAIDIGIAGGTDDGRLDVMIKIDYSPELLKSMRSWGPGPGARTPDAAAFFRKLHDAIVTLEDACEIAVKEGMIKL